jgi:hypothetical protein
MAGPRRLLPHSFVAVNQVKWTPPGARQSTRHVAGQALGQRVSQAGGAPFEPSIEERKKASVTKQR